MPKDPIRAVVVDDEPLARGLIVGLAAAHQGLSIVGQAGTGAGALRLIAETRPDLAFLDIKMPDIDGIELMRRLRELSNPPFIVLVTAFDQFAIDAFELDALDYLVKPIEKLRFKRSVERASEAVRSTHMQRLCREMVSVAAGEQRAVSGAPDAHVIIRQRDELIRVAENDILWLEAASQYVRIHTASDSFLVAEPLNKYHAKLDANNFVRVHRSAVINVARIVRISKNANGTHDLQLTDGTSITLSRSRKQLVRSLLRRMSAD